MTLTEHLSQRKNALINLCPPIIYAYGMEFNWLSWLYFTASKERQRGEIMRKRTLTSHGYISIYAPGHPLADSRGRIYEHRFVAYETFGPIAKTDIVHHKNGIKSDNRPENLEVVKSTAEHFFHHRKRTDLRLPGQPNEVISCGCGCGATFLQFDEDGRPRTIVSGHHRRGAKNSSAHTEALFAGRRPKIMARRNEILRLRILGKTVKEIAESLGVHFGCVYKHIKRIRESDPQCGI